MKAERGRAGPPRAVVLGAGVAGLYAGRVLAALGAKVTVLEKEAVVGGLASGVEIGGNFHDMGVHHLHAFDREIFDDIRRLMGDRLRPVRKVAQVRYGRGYRQYPLEFVDILTGIPPWTLTRSVMGLAAQMVRNRFATSEAETAEEALVELYGRPLYEYFFRDFTTEYWGLGPRQLSATFVRRKMPRLSAIDVMKKGLARLGLKDSDGAAVESALREETLWYSPTGARELPMTLAQAIEADGGVVLTDTPVEAVVLGDGGAVEAVTHPRGRVACDLCLSTIPLPGLVAA
ncbi:MAG: FAD-dependent oxidoreductase, partial [Anaerolineae bacterium]